MPVLILMLLLGLLAAVWGFMACFLPSQWNQLQEKMSFADQWSESSPKPQHPLIRVGMRIGQFIGGLATCAVGCWFTYLAASGIYRRLTGQAVIHAAPVSGALPNSPAPAATALTVFMIVAGILMAVFPAKAVAVFERVWPAGRTVSPSAAPKVMLAVRLCGVFFAFLALMSLLH